MSGTHPRATALLALLFAMACGEPPVKAPPGPEATPPEKPAEPPAPPPIVLEGGQGAFVMKQRSRRAIPGSDDKIFVTLDDITAGQVSLGIERRDGAEIVAPRPRKPGEQVNFELSGHAYTLTIASFDLHMLHDDGARLTITSDTQAPPDKPVSHKKLSQEQRIEALIKVVEGSGVTFVRNGTEHDATEAAAHLRKKRERAGDRIRTAEDFIEHLGTRSSMSGEAYQIRLPDGRQLPSADYLNEQLARIDGK